MIRPPYRIVNIGGQLAYTHISGCLPTYLHALKQYVAQAAGWPANERGVIVGLLLCGC